MADPHESLRKRSHDARQRSEAALKVSRALRVKLALTRADRKLLWRFVSAPSDISGNRLGCECQQLRDHPLWPGLPTWLQHATPRSALRSRLDDPTHPVFYSCTGCGALWIRDEEQRWRSEYTDRDDISVAAIR